MRMYRAALSILIAGMLTLGLSVVVAGPAEARLPSRTIKEKNPKGMQVAWNAYKLKGKVTEPQADGTTLPYRGKVKIQKKKCGKCSFKTVKKIKTDKAGKYKTRIFVPLKGRWKWRVKIKGSDGFRTTKGETWTVFFP